MKLCVCAIILMFAVGVCYSQDNLKFGNTGTTSTAPTYKPQSKKHKGRHMIQWIKGDSKGLLLGNKCMQDITNDMGFVYVVQPKGQVGNRSEFERQVHNFFAKIGITFRNGPFWKFKLKKKRKECRRSTGDFVG